MSTLPDPQLVQLVSQRMNLSADETAALARGDVQTVLSRRFAGDPQMQALLHLARNLQSDEATMDVQPVVEQRSSVDKRAMVIKKYRKRMAVARRIVQQLEQDVHAAHVVIEHIAHVLGACPGCFGEDDECELCHGHGVPGSMMPMKDEFLSWVEPALARLGLTTTAIQPDPPRREASNQQPQGAIDE